MKLFSPKIKRLFPSLLVLMFFCSLVFMFFVCPSLAQGRWGTDLWEGKGVFVEASEGMQSVFVNVVMWMMSIVALLALGFIVYGAIKYVTSAGNEKQVEEAKKILLYAIIGLVIAILAVVIIQLVVRVVERGEMEANCCKVYDLLTKKVTECNSGKCDYSDYSVCTLDNIECTDYYCEKGSEACAKIGDRCGCQ